MGSCSYCEVDCFSCIERQETKYSFINQKKAENPPKKEIKIIKPQEGDFTLMSTFKRFKNDDMTSVHSIEENIYKKNNMENYNNSIYEYNNKENEIIVKNLKSEININNNKSKNYNTNINENCINNDNISNALNEDTNNKYFEEMNKEGTEEEKRSEGTFRYYNTNFKSSNVSFIKYFEKIEDNSKNFDMTDNSKVSQIRLTKIFPFKFNYQKDKYINYFADNDI